MKFSNNSLVKISILLIFCLFHCLNSQIIPCKTNYDNVKYNGTCKLVDECTGAALRGNCQNKEYTCCIRDVDPPNVDENVLLTKEVYFSVVPITSRTVVFYNYLAHSLQNSEINNQLRIAAYLSAMLSVCNLFLDLESNMADSDFNPELGNNSTGDGSLYRARGIFPIKGKINYLNANNSLNLGIFLRI